jgi:hypothetical protein
MPVSRVVSPPTNKPVERLVPPEEPTVEPWEDAEGGDPGAEASNKPAARLNSAAQLRKPPINPAPTPVSRNLSFTPQPRANPGAAETRSQVLPRMELKPVLPADPARSGINVAPARPRISVPPLRQVNADAALPAEPPVSPESTPVRPANPFSRPAAAAPAVSPSAVPAAGGEEGAPELGSVLERLANLPAQTAILGVCDDRLPVLLDLSDPAPGAILVASDDDTLRLRLLRTLLQTAAALNSPRSVQFLVLSSAPEVWRAWLDHLDIARHCLGVDGLLEGSADRWLLKLSNWADQRRTGSNGPAVILVVDDLAAVPKMEYDARVNFDWLVKEGPAVRIWPVSALAVEDAPELVRWVRLFKTRILGPAADPALYRQLASVDEQEGAALVDETQFAVRINENWLKFRIPVLQGETA